MARIPSINEMQPQTGRMQKEDNTVINVAEVAEGLSQSYEDESVTVIDYAHRKVHQGEMWTYDNTKLAVADLGTYILRIKTGTKRIHFNIDWIGEFKTRFKTYSGATITTPGTRVYPFNRKLDSTAVLVSEFYADPTFTGGTLRGNSFKGASGNVQTRAGGAGSAGLESNFAPNSEFIIVLENVSGVAADLGYIINCYEEPA